jgi:hypothetical protein
MAKPRKKKPSKASAARVNNKSAWIRGQSQNLSAKDVVSKAKAKGIKLSLAQVYTARSTGKKKAHTPAAAPRAGTDLESGQDLRHQFVMIASRLGTDEAQRLLDRLVDVQTPMP